MRLSWLLIALLVAGCSGTMNGVGEDMQRAGAKLSNQSGESPPPPATYGNAGPTPLYSPHPYSPPATQPYSPPAYSPPAYPQPGYNGNQDRYPLYDDRQR